MASLNTSVSSSLLKYTFTDEDGDVILANTKRVVERAWAMLEDEE